MKPIMISRLFPLLFIFTLTLGSTVQKEDDVSLIPGERKIGPGKKQFDETIVRPDIIDVNKLITTIRDNWHLQKTEEGLAKLCKMIMFKYPAAESNEIFKAARYPFPTNPSLNSQYLNGTYFICPTHMVKTTTHYVNGITAKSFDGKHTIRNHYGNFSKPCDLKWIDVPFFYGFTKSFIDKAEYPNVYPSLILDFPFTAQDEVRSLGLVPGLSAAWDNIYVAVGGRLPDVYQYQFIAFPITEKVCPGIEHPALETLDQPEIPSSNKLKAQNLRG